MATGFDVFVSYARSDRKRVARLVDALVEQGLKIWIDHGEIPNFAALREQIENGLARSRALLACYSATYPQRRWCMAELAAAMTAVEQRPELRGRLLVINLESGIDHIVPRLLCESLLPGLPEEQASAAAFSPLAGEIARQLRTYETTLGEIAISAVPTWYGPPRHSSGRFTGREAALWEIHEALVSADRPFSSGGASHGICQVRGLGGLGKSLVIEEYAWRFAAAWPGGIFWLDAPGDSMRREGSNLYGTTSALEISLRQIVEQLGGNSQGMTVSAMQVFIGKSVGERAAPGLWIVDDLPVGFQASQVREWLSPNPLLRTLVSTRSLEHGGLGRVIALAPLRSEEAALLLTLDDAGNAEPNAPSNAAWANELATRLGRHPLALDVTRAALRVMRGVQTPEQFIESLDREEDDVLALASELSSELPNGHDKQIAASLIAGLEHLSDQSRTLLRLGALCAESPIPVALLLGAFAAVTGSDEARSGVPVLLALKALQDRALCTRGADGSLLLHSLISRSIRFRERDSADYRLAARRLHDTLAMELAGFERYDELVRLGALEAHALAVLNRVDGERRVLEAALGDYFYTSSHFDEAARKFGAAYASERRTRNLDDPSLLDLANRYALALSSTGDAERAVAVFSEALGSYEQLGSAYEAETILLKGNLAAALRNLGRVPESLAIEREVFDWRIAHLGPDAPLTLTSLHQLATAEDMAGNADRALELERVAYERRERNLGPRHMHTLLSLQALAQYEARSGTAVNARRYAEENARRRIDLLGLDHPYARSGLRVLCTIVGSSDVLTEFGLTHAEVFGKEVWAVESNKAVACLGEGRLREALTILDSLLGDDVPRAMADNCLLRHNRLAALVQLGCIEEASAFGRALVEDERKHLGEHFWLTLQSQYYLAMNLPVTASHAERASALEAVVSAMRAALSATDRPRLRAELELMLARSSAAPGSISRDELNALRARVLEVGEPRPGGIPAGCIFAAIEAAAGSPEALGTLEAELDGLAAAVGARHPQVARFTWLLCRLQHERHEEAWRPRLASLRWLADDNAELGALTRRCLHEISGSGWAADFDGATGGDSAPPSIQSL